MNKLKKLILMANQDIDDGNDADYPPYLCFQALESDFSVCLGGDWHDHECQYSFNRRDWFNLPARTYTPVIGILQKVYFRANLKPTFLNPGDSNSTASIGYFYTTKKCRLSGSPTSMLHGEDCLTDRSVPNYGLAYLFQSAKVESVSKDFFDFTSVSTRACFCIFQGNEYLKGSIYITKAADSSTKNGVFMGAFRNCKLDSVFITTAEYAWQTYTEAFSGSLIKILNLPATYISPYMYSKICEFSAELEEVFINGRSLGFGTDTYLGHLNDSFLNCNKLSKVTYLVSNYPFDKRYTNNWLTGVAEDGIIILNKFITWNPEEYRNGNVDNIEGSATFGQVITWGIPPKWEIKYCGPANPEDIRDSREEFIEYGDYMTLEYIQTNGNQYLDSQIVLSGNSRIEVDARPTTSTSTTAYVLCGNSYDTNNRITINPTNVYNGTSRFNGAKFEGNLYREGRHTWTTDKNGLYIDGEKVGEWDTAPSEIQHNTSFYILADRLSTGTGVQLKALTGARIYGLKVYENGELVADMVPVLSISQNKPGLYDKVNKRFLTNIGTGEFTYQ